MVAAALTAGARGRAPGAGAGTATPLSLAPTANLGDGASSWFQGPRAIMTNNGCEVTASSVGGAGSQRGRQRLGVDPRRPRSARRPPSIRASSTTTTTPRVSSSSRTVSSCAAWSGHAQDTRVRTAVRSTTGRWTSLSGFSTFGLTTYNNVYQRSDGTVLDFVRHQDASDAVVQPRRLLVPRTTGGRGARSASCSTSAAHGGSSVRTSGTRSSGTGSPSSPRRAIRESSTNGRHRRGDLRRLPRGHDDLPQRRHRDRDTRHGGRRHGPHAGLLPPRRHGAWTSDHLLRGRRHADRGVLGAGSQRRMGLPTRHPLPPGALPQRRMGHATTSDRVGGPCTPRKTTTPAPSRPDPVDPEPRRGVLDRRSDERA